ncbi:MAG: hypothetical protein AAGD14_04795 [Planctomycetota bacterium]
MKRTLLLLLPLLIASGPAAASLGELEGLMPEIRSLPRPDWVKPGARIVFWNMTSMKEMKKDGVSSAGAGFLEVNVVAVEGKTVALETRIFLAPSGSESEVPMLAGSTSSVHGAGGGVRWVHPKALQALLKRPASGNVKVGRLEKTIDGHKMTTVMIATPGSTYQFDEASGVLVASSQYMTAKAVEKSGVRNSATMELRGFHHVSFPWAQEQLPGWTANIKEFRYRGSMVQRIAGAPEVRVPMSFKHERTGGGATWFFTRLTGEASRPTPPKQVVSGIGNLGLCLPPRALAKLQPGAVLMRSRWIRSEMRVRHVGAHQGKQIAVIEEESPQFKAVWHYDLKSGVLLRTSVLSKAEGREVELQLEGTS